jgi:putative solute:sodium symporter small subunit
MAPDQNQYHFSFFKPTTQSARRNRNMIIQFVLIWAIAIFGFQTLLKVLGKPTPEPDYLLFQTSWESVQAGNPSKIDLQNTARTALSVLGKGFIQPRHRDALDNAVSWLAYEIADSAQKESLIEAVTSFEAASASTTDITDPVYVAQKNELIPILAELFDLEPADVRGKIAPVEVKSSGMGTIQSENRELLVEAMGLYMLHNRSVLTDTKFLGFPFHYFYTAVFLLILFVGLCWLYCVRTDMFNKRYGIEE